MKKANPKKGLHRDFRRVVHAHGRSAHSPEDAKMVLATRVGADVARTLLDLADRGGSFELSIVGKEINVKMKRSPDPDPCELGDLDVLFPADNLPPCPAHKPPPGKR